MSEGIASPAPFNNPIPKNLDLYLLFAVVMISDIPAVVLPAAVIQIGIFGWACVWIGRTMGIKGAGGRMIFMAMFPMLYAIFKALTVAGVLRLQGH